jgi:integrase
VLTSDEIVAFNRAIAGHPYEHIWRVLLATGVRWGELAALQWGDVDFDAPHITIDKAYTRVTKGRLGGETALDPARMHGGLYLKDPKTPREAPIPLVPDAVAALRAQRARVDAMKQVPGWPEHNLVFPNLTGEPLRNNNPLRELKAVMTRAGMTGRTLRGMRHTFATQLFRRGVHVKAAQQLLGHSRPDMTLSTYTGSVPAVLREAMASMADLFGDASSA